ncbi:MAG: hypothetical protein A2666_01360 [Parcubacteria group bacterium RIFCSPHIGHO2_01_FULL_47_10b]|nr:MAG: hypothetical protein A2666_01360 [Parcubacteria group bacterium RIFCSPHIGHO2_01_FULL_47_10b]
MPSTNRKKKRTARKALLLFLKRLRAGCGLYKDANEWYGHMKDLKGLLETYTDVLPKEPLEKVNAAMKLTDTTSAGLKRACKVLRYDLNSLIKKLPRFSWIGSVAVTGLVTVAVVAGAAAVYWQMTKVKVTIKNENCSNIPIAESIPQEINGTFKKFGVKLPLWIITNGQETFNVPPVGVRVEAHGSSLALTLFDRSFSVPLPERVQSITFNDRELLEQETDIDLGSQKKHTVVVRCD